MADLVRTHNTGPEKYDINKNITTPNGTHVLLSCAPEMSTGEVLARANRQVTELYWYEINKRPSPGPNVHNM